ncbi:LysR family transcriptional regulator [Streptomyces eurocidicus]|uniref:DNA-binding transcriptional LysR family regulator n=1 Tax=Streptomyces eurocidicus TaxID=66423 RepID=A0A2N8NXZ1_STREU|nr:LysR family transcriptional regulator [Streptomyces eurocidicus]MBB5119725.1 DNA-binding transcriptional LysR family regulator [Streptomyces eurocidicus]MBF6050748.1 LysR family transcriptional regulator [Streptomyces eurocidicus]PNE33626.1 LysR family transcriptional regulator [Streptomyces eurocidicus]
MELRQLRYFVTVAEELHFGRAAERLHIVQSAVSQQVRRLERELGVEFFDRSPRHVRLTPAGERFLPEARSVLAAEARARAVAAELTGARGATLRLGTSTGLGDHLDRVLESLARRAPDLGVELLSAPARSRLDQVAAGGLDAAFVRAPEEHPGVRLIPVWQDQLVVALPARHPLASAPDVALADLAGLPLRLTDRRNNPPLVDLVVSACRDAGFAPVPGPPSSSLQNTLAAIGAASPMWTVVYASHARQLRTGKVAFRPVRGEGLSLPTALAVHPSSPPAALGALLAACADHDS